MNNLIIRRTTPYDIPKVAQILSSSEAWMCYGTTYNIAKQNIETMADDSYVGFIDDSVVGFITLRVDGIGNFGAYIRMLAVAEPYRGKGIGRMLIDYISNLAFQKTQNLFLICSEQNIMAQRFYEKVGFVQVGALSDLVIKGQNEILYRKTIGPMKRGIAIQTNQ